MFFRPHGNNLIKSIVHKFLQYSDHKGLYFENIPMVTLDVRLRQHAKSFSLCLFYLICIVGGK